MKKSTIYLLTGLLLFLGACKDTPKANEEVETIESIVNESTVTRIDSTLNSIVASGNIAGVSALIFEKGKEVYYNNFGYMDLEAKKPMDRNTLVQIYSMTKPITGTALMTLWEEGKFNLDDPLEKYAPEFANMKVYVGEDASGNPILEDVNRPITIRDLTRHTAGFGNNKDFAGLSKLITEANAMNRENTLVQMAEKLGSLPLTFHPGEEWLYGPCVDVQAFLVERISGIPYKEYVRTHVLDPLKMTKTRYFIPEEDRGDFSAIYLRSGAGLDSLKQLSVEDSKTDYFSIWPLTRGGSGLTASIDNYQRFARMLVNKGTFDGATILKPETIKLMATSHLADSVTERSWLPTKGQMGFGIDFAVRVAPPKTVEENNGVVGEFYWDGAASTLFWVDPVNELTAVMFVQLFPYDKIGLHKAFRDAVYGPVILN